MKSIVVIYYSYSGNTAAAAQAMAQELGAELVKAEDVEYPGKFKAYVSGAFAARKEKSWPIKALPTNINSYDRVFIGGPVWWGKQAPEVNAVIDQIDLTGKQVVPFVTLGGNDYKEAIAAMSARIQSKGGTIAGSFYIKTGGVKKEDIALRAQEAVKEYK